MKFTKLNTVSKITKNDIEVLIVKYIKTGTNRTFYRPEVEGLGVSKTMFARKYDAKNLATRYISSKA